MEEKNGKVEPKVLPVEVYQVSRDWIHNLFCEVKRQVLSRAILADCSKDFLVGVNDLEISFTDDLEVLVDFPSPTKEEKRSPPTPEVKAAAPVEKPAEAPTPVPAA